VTTYFTRSELRAVSRDLRHHAHTPPPTFVETATALGWDDTARRINDWTAAGKPGHWTDPDFDQGFDSDQEEGDDRG
jgi:hypothetical protein